MTKILLIEDNPVDIEMIRTRLKKKGYQVIVATDGEEGVKRALKENPDLILMDMILPLMHGLEATIKLKEAPETREIPIIAITVLGSPDFVNKCYNEGVCAFVRKPYEFEELFDKIEKSIGSQKKTAKKILVIDNEPAFLTMLTMSLMRHEYQVISASEATSGVKHAQKEKPDLILLDNVLPENGGSTVFEELKKSDNTKSIPIILMADQLSSKELKKKATQLGAEDYIPKPFGSREVIRKIEKILSE